MAETKPIPVRLNDELIKRLDDAAARIGNTRAGLIKFCVDTFLRHFEKRGEAMLPPDWKEILAEFDGRTRASKGQVLMVGAGASPKTQFKPLQPGGLILNEDSNSKLTKEAGAFVAGAEKVADPSPKSRPKPSTASPTARKSRPSSAASKRSKHKPGPPVPAPTEHEQ